MRGPERRSRPSTEGPVEPPPLEADEREPVDVRGDMRDCEGAETERVRAPRRSGRRSVERP